MSLTLDECVARLKSDDVEACCQAAEELMRQGDRAQAAAIPLLEACAQCSDEVHETAIPALEAIGSPAVADVGRLSELAANEHADVSYWAATLLGRLEGHSAGAVTALVSALRSKPVPATAERIAWALGKIGPQAAQARETLENLAGGDSRLARTAARALEQIQ